MSKAIITVDRLLVLLAALGLIFLGVWSILFYIDNPYARELAEYRNSRIWLSASKQPWFDWALGAIAVVAFIIGIWLIVANLRRRRIRTVASETASTDQGQISFNVSHIASAVASNLESCPKVTKVNSLTAFDRGRKSMEFTIHAAADVNVTSLRSQCAQAERDIRAAVGDADIDTSYRIELDAVDHTPELVRTVN